MAPSRREFPIAAAAWTALAAVTRARAWADPLDPALRRWILRIGEIGHAVQNATLAPTAWQDAMRELHPSIPLEDLVRWIDLDRLLEARRPDQHLRRPRQRGGIPRGHQVGRDNAHWFEGASDALAISFDIPILDITLEKPHRHPAEAHNQIYLDPTVPPPAPTAKSKPRS